ncbi:protein-glutamine gamma-glutamyltransferase [Metabacillus endolithicus]|uniref:Protein-glutamine gamma-glutamyltransferase n=1 Tax=Metabacillus endolithicus TaxID=1535204 RepID=A0ABW5C1X0_9BACI|nr:protein-glutamine gamma-glutamyltransferase [Metabacillus endolithicus]UPG64998.1 protein-glutamine gamma-glutamyltransferase [Metabacillus endolithicus]
MIIIGNREVNGNELKSSAFKTEQIEMIDKMDRYQESYSFMNNQHFQFTLQIRYATIQAARHLLASKAKFTTFERAHCNERFWNLTEQGGFKLKQGMNPADAINDIFQNGVEYGFECATAMVIIFYKAVLDSINNAQFNRIYQGIYLRDWQSDNDLPIYTRRGNDYLPGDCLYFDNPQFNPKTPQWRGENVIDLGNDLYFGHGIGIKTAEGIIESLNKRRKAYATESAYLLSQVTRLDNRYLYQFSNNAQSRAQIPTFLASKTIVSKIGSATFYH